MAAVIRCSRSGPTQAIRHPLRTSSPYPRRTYHRCLNLAAYSFWVLDCSDFSVLPAGDSSKRSLQAVYGGARGLWKLRALFCPLAIFERPGGPGPVELGFHAGVGETLQTRFTGLNTEGNKGF